MSRRHVTPVSERPRLATFAAAVISILLATIFGVASSARAQGLEGRPFIDITTVSCRELLKTPLPRALVLVGWLGGYFSGLRNESRVDPRKFIEDADRVLLRCQEDETLALIEVAKQEFRGP